MDAFERLKILSSAMDIEYDGDVRDRVRSETVSPVGKDASDLKVRRDAICLGSAQMPNGQRITMLKTLVTSACERNCFYCPFRAGRDFRRATLKPDELADTFMALHRAGIVQGAFFSSGVAGGSVRTQDLILDAAAILREKRHYQGYLHLKLMPGAEFDQIRQAMRLADRVSVNLEAPNTRRLEDLAPRKSFLDELLQPLRWVEHIRRTEPGYLGWNGRWPSSTTQFVVGAVGESDLELLSTTQALYNRLHLRRAYFSPFRPVHDTPFENLPGETVQREHRLYQASFLLRDYQFDMEDLLFDPTGNLPGDVDPKLAWARRHLSEDPVEINLANRRQLLRVPGIGLKGATAILSARRQSPFRSTDDLRRVGINAERCSPFILLDGHRPPRQLSFSL